MALTPKQVIEELAKTGRRIEARTLTDWGTRGLVPKPIEKGRGRGKGKSYFWTDDNILDRVALVADLPSWETDRTILVLWFCGFDVSPEQMKEAWLKSIERVSRQLAKQDMDTPAGNTAQLSYFDELEDALHGIASAFRRQKKAESDAVSEFAYELAQLGFSFVLANSVSDDFKEELENINYYLAKYKPPFEQSSDYKLPEIDLEFILSKRKFTNIFDIRKAAQTATLTQLETAQSIWKTICRVIGQFWPEELPAELGLTTSRRFQGAFGPLVQSLIVIALQTEGQAAFVQIFELLAAGADKFNAARKRGAWTGHEGAQQFWTESRTHPLEHMENLWLEFWDGVDRPVLQQK
jgi:hypothetical protein